MSPRLWLSIVSLCGLLLALACLPGWGDDGKKGKAHALLVGVKDYSRATLGPLKYTENDVEELAKVLDKDGSPFKGNVRLLTCTRGTKDAKDVPTAENVRKALASLVKGRRDGDTVLVALAGHGIQLSVRDPKNKGKERSYAYFCPQDADLVGADYETGRHEHLLLLSDLLGDLGDCGAGVKLVLMDACRDERSARSIRLNKELVPDGVAALFSCKTGQKAFETDKLGGKGHGVFFHHVIQALRGEAADKRGRVTWSGLVDHVTEKVAEDVPSVIGGGARQTPHEIKNFAGGTPVLVSSLGAGDSKKDKAVKQPVVKDAEKKLVVKDADSGFEMELLLIPATGDKGFLMGSTKEEQDAAIADYEKNFTKASNAAKEFYRIEGPRHRVVISQPFYLGKYEVTQAQYQALMGTNPSQFRKDGGAKEAIKDVPPNKLAQLPVDSVSWKDAQAFLKKLNGAAERQKRLLTFRLPTEAEWEYACRGRADNEGPFDLHGKPGRSIHSSQANFDGRFPFGGASNGYFLNRPAPVGSYKPNGFGLFDMHGNVYEWCEDAADNRAYMADGRTDPSVPAEKEGANRVTRGGCYSVSGQYCRAAHRSAGEPSVRNTGIGFRVAAVPRSR